MGSPTILGIASIENVHRVIRGFPGAFQNCYLDRLESEAVQRGEPRIKMTLGQYGEVMTTQFVDRAGVPNDVAWCVVRRCCQAQFYAPETVQTTIEIPFTVMPTEE